MMIFKKAIPRRTLLRGAGAALALPLLDGMIPALAGPSDTVANLFSAWDLSTFRMESYRLSGCLRRRVRASR